MKKADRIARARKAGLASAGICTPAKLASARANGKLGGRPANPEIQAIMRARGVSRQRAHQIMRQNLKLA